jgi:hypothetical protein
LPPEALSPQGVSLPPEVSLPQGAVQPAVMSGAELRALLPQAVSLLPQAVSLP